MSDSAQTIPRKWVTIVAVIVLLLAFFVVWLLLGTGGETTDPVTVAFYQLNPDGTPIPWGEPAEEETVRLRAEPSRPELYKGARFVIESRESRIELEAPMGRSFVEATSEQLEYGAYRWSVQLQRQDGTVPGGLLRPRVDGEGPDFIILPPPRINDLKQLKLTGERLPPGEESMGGAILVGKLNRPDARFDVEVKPVGRAFDEGGLLTAPPGTAKEWRVLAELQPGDYHWRARALVLGGARGSWLDFGENGKDADFVVPPPQDAPGVHPDDSQSGAGSYSSGSFGGGLGGGRSTPHPRVVDPLTSLWDLLTSRRMLVGSAIVLVLACGLVLLIITLVRIRRKRS